MPETPPSDVRLLDVAQVADILGCTVDEVMGLVRTAQLRGFRVGTSARWRIDEASVQAYLDDLAEVARRTALWEQSNEASFPELWGTGSIRHGD